MTVERAAQLLRERENACVIYPTETVYGLAADALSPTAIERVFELKGRSHENPISLAVANAEAALEYTHATDRERAFVAEFLPGPVTVVLERRSVVPDALTASKNRVGIRIPDHPTALALLQRATPLTATSANKSGAGSARAVEDIDAGVRDAVDLVLNEGTTPGTESTVVDVSTETIHRRGALADEIEAWLASEQ